MRVRDERKERASGWEQYVDDVVHFTPKHFIGLTFFAFVLFLCLYLGRIVLVAKHVVAALGQMLEILFDQGYRKSDKELRNEVLIILMILSEEAGSSHLFLDSGILDTVLTYAAAAEIERPTPGDVHNYATFSEADFELKRLLWRFLVVVTESGGEAIRVRVAQSPLVKTLLMYIDFQAMESCVAIKRWSLVQMKILQEDALVTLQSLALLCPEVFKKVGFLSLQLVWTTRKCNKKKLIYTGTEWGARNYDDLPQRTNI